MAQRTLNVRLEDGEVITSPDPLILLQGDTLVLPPAVTQGWKWILDFAQSPDGADLTEEEKPFLKAGSPFSDGTTTFESVDAGEGVPVSVLTEDAPALILHAPGMMDDAEGVEVGAAADSIFLFDLTIEMEGGESVSAFSKRVKIIRQL